MASAMASEAKEHLLLQKDNNQWLILSTAETTALILPLPLPLKARLWVSSWMI